jgi:hypothetical protein
LNSLLPAPEPANLPVLRRPATVAVRAQHPAPSRLSNGARTVIAATILATPFAGLMISLVGGVL